MRVTTTSCVRVSEHYLTATTTVVTGTAAVRLPAEGWLRCVDAGRKGLAQARRVGTVVASHCNGRVNRRCVTERHTTHAITLVVPPCTVMHSAGVSLSAVNDTDLGVAMAAGLVTAPMKDKPRWSHVCDNTVFIGAVTETGRIMPVDHLRERLDAAARRGFRTAMVAATDAQLKELSLLMPSIYVVSTVAEAFVIAHDRRRAITPRVIRRRVVQPPRAIEAAPGSASMSPTAAVVAAPVSETAVAGGGASVVAAVESASSLSDSLDVEHVDLLVEEVVDAPAEIASGVLPMSAPVFQEPGSDEESLAEAVVVADSSASCSSAEKNSLAEHVAMSAVTDLGERVVAVTVNDTDEDDGCGAVSGTDEQLLAALCAVGGCGVSVSGFRYRAAEDLANQVAELITPRDRRCYPVVHTSYSKLVLIDPSTAHLMASSRNQPAVVIVDSSVPAAVQRAYAAARFSSPQLNVVIDGQLHPVWCVIDTTGSVPGLIEYHPVEKRADYAAQLQVAGAGTVISAGMTQRCLDGRGRAATRIAAVTAEPVSLWGINYGLLLNGLVQGCSLTQLCRPLVGRDSGTIRRIVRVACMLADLQGQNYPDAATVSSAAELLERLAAKPVPQRQAS